MTRTCRTASETQGAFPPRHRPRCTRRQFLTAATGVAALRATSAIAQTGAPIPDVDRIAAALPTAAPAAPARPRRLLIFDLNVGYPGHASIPTANAAFELMGKRTGAFATEIHRNPDVFRPDSLARFDGVFFNNTVGNLFEDPALRRALVEFVYSGGGLMGVHGTSVAFTRWPGAHEDWPEFGRMLGARGASHLAADEHARLIVDDPAHPLTAMFPPDGFEHRDEFFRFGEPFSRDRVRVLLHLDTSRVAMPEGRKPFRRDDDYAVTWARRYGRGRIFYSAIAHHPRVFWDPAFLQFYLAAAQFALGDLPVPTMPSALLTPAARAQERLGWRKGIEADLPPATPLADIAARARPLGAAYIGASYGQVLDPATGARLDASLDPAALERLRLSLDKDGVTLLTLRIPDPSPDAHGWRERFEFARKIGAETVIAESLPSDLAAIGSLCDTHDIRLAIAGDRPEPILAACKHASPRIGACAEIQRWIRAGIDPAAAIRTLGNRLVTIASRGPSQLPEAGGRAILTAIRDENLRPAMFAFGPSAATDQIPRFDALSLDLAGGPVP